MRVCVCVRARVCVCKPVQAKLRTMCFKHH